MKDNSIPVQLQAVSNHCAHYMPPLIKIAMFKKINDIKYNFTTATSDTALFTQRPMCNATA